MQIKLNKIGKKYIDKNWLFKDFSANIYTGDIIGIYGPNGNGKTTLLNLISKDESPNLGKVTYEPDKSDTVGYFRQIYLDEIEDLDLETKSGGEKVLELIKQVTDIQREIYLFDEPTNHLDESNKKIIASEIKNLKGIKVIASHDKEFLSMVCNKIWHIRDGKITTYKTNFEKFFQTKNDADYSMEEKYKKIFQKINDLRSNDKWRQDKFSAMKKSGKADPVKVFRKKQKFMHQNTVYKNRIRRMIHEELPTLPQERKDFLFNLLNSDSEYSYLMDVTDLSKKFGTRVLFKNLNFEIIPTEKVLVTGANGSGKTTLLRILAELEKDYQGTIKRSEDLNIAYFKQENFDDLNYDNNVREEFVKFIVGDVEHHNIHDDQILEHIQKLEFDKSYLDRLVSELSEGEKIKLRFAKILLLEPNLLILDEPTNHLDDRNKLAVVRAIKSFKGAIVAVTHDPEIKSAIEWDFNIDL